MMPYRGVVAALLPILMGASAAVGSTLEGQVVAAKGALLLLRAARLGGLQDHRVERRRAELVARKAVLRRLERELVRLEARARHRRIGMDPSRLRERRPGERQRQNENGDSPCFSHSSS